MLAAERCVTLNCVNPLVTVDALAAELADDPPVLLDVRWRLEGPPTYQDYLAGHLPGAVFADLDRDLADPPGDRGRHPMPDPAALEATLRRWGVRESGRVVAYDDADATIASRAWWLLRWAGVADVRILDGGLRAWLAGGQPLSDVVPAPPAGDVVVRPGQMPVVDADGAAAMVRDGVLLDARAEERYRGEVEPMDKVAGHIPGAVSAPVAGNTDADGRLLSRESLRARFAGLGADSSQPIGVYCGSGVTATQEVFALELAGVPAALYPGSWSEWIAGGQRPVATGEG